MAANGDTTNIGWARRYAGLGWTVIPIGAGTDGKKPRLEAWKEYQTRRPTDAELAEWFGKPKTYPAVILGAASGGLVCRDFDAPGAYTKWADEHLDLARSLPTVRTGRGHHVYCLSDWSGFIDVGDGELRGDNGHYCLLPPAVHRATGRTYAWTGPPPGSGKPIPKLDPFTVGLAPMHQSEAKAISLVPSGSFCFTLPHSVAWQSDARVQDAIRKTLPQDEGQRNRAVFQFARRLKGIPELAGAEALQLAAIVREWHRRARPVIGTKPYADTLADFVHGWDRVKKPVALDYLRRVYERAELVRIDGLDDERLSRLAGMCKVLQEDTGDSGPFYLAQRDAAKPFGVHCTTAGKWLGLLEKLGIIRTVTRGSGIWATRFRYVGPGASDGKGNGDDDTARE